MPSFNKVVLIGRLTRDPELRYTSSNLAVCSFSIAVDRRFKNQSGEKQTDFFRCSAWRQTAEFVNSYVTKGKLIAVEGRIEINKFVGQDGIEKQSADIVCDQVELLESNREQGEGGGAGGGYSGGQSTPSAPRQAPAGGGQADTGNGYYPDDEMAAAPAPQNPAPRPAQANPNASAARPAAAPNRPAPGAPAARPAPKPEPAYPENDFDDSDPFSDE